MGGWEEGRKGEREGGEKDERNMKEREGARKKGREEVSKRKSKEGRGREEEKDFVSVYIDESELMAVLDWSKTQQHC